MEMGRAQNEDYAPPVAVIPRADDEQRRRERAEWPEAEIAAREGDEQAYDELVEPVFDEPEQEAYEPSRAQHSLPLTTPSGTQSARVEAGPVAAAPAQPLPGQAALALGRDDRRRLQLVLLELDECKRILEAARG